MTDGQQAKSLPTSFRVSQRFRSALKAAARQARRSQANMLEVLVFDYCERHGIDPYPLESSATAQDNSEAGCARAR